MINYIEKLKIEYLQKNASGFRFGSIDDGGYVISPKSIYEIDILFSGGISSNIEFEYDIFRFNKNIEIVMVDPTVSKYKLLSKAFARCFFKKPDKLRYIINTLNFIYVLRSKRVTHVKKWLNNKFGVFNCLDYLKINTKDKKILLKLDIEGSEYDLLNEIIEKQDLFNCMVFEFHYLDENYQLLFNFLDKLNNKFVLNYLEINPFGGFSKEGYPKNIEITLERK